MTSGDIRRFQSGLRAGATDPKRVIDELTTQLDDLESEPARRRAFRVLVSACEQAPEFTSRATRVVLEAADNFEGETLFEDFEPELEALLELARIRPSALRSAARPLGRLVESSYEFERPTVRILSRLATLDPGVVRPATPSLVEAVIEEYNAAGAALQALVDLHDREPTVLRPFVAGQVQQLDADDPDAISVAIQQLGGVGLGIPELVPDVAIDGIEQHLSHPEPSVRIAALRAIGDIGAQRCLELRWIGAPAPDVVEPLVDPIRALLGGGSGKVRKTAARTLGRIGRTDAAIRSTVLGPLRATVVEPARRHGYENVTIEDARATDGALVALTHLADVRQGSGPEIADVVALLASHLTMDWTTRRPRGAIGDAALSGLWYLERRTDGLATVDSALAAKTLLRLFGVALNSSNGKAPAILWEVDTETFDPIDTATLADRYLDFAATLDRNDRFEQLVEHLELLATVDSETAAVVRDGLTDLLAESLAREDD